MNKLAAMQTFVAIVDEGSLSAAAAALGKALPTVVRSLATLEAALGVRLLRRTTRRMSLTDEGRLYVERCRRILADVAEAERALSRQHGELRGELRVTAPVLYGQRKIAPAVTRFLQSHPGVKVELLLLDRVVNLVEEGIDVGVRIAPLADSSMIATRIGEERHVVVASPELLRRVKAPKHPRDLSEKPAVHFQGLSISPVWRFLVNGREVAVPVAGAFTCNQAAVAVEACVAGLGFGQFLAYQVDDAVREKQLRVVLEEFERAAVPVHVVFSENRLMSARVRAFVDCLKLPDGEDGAVAHS